MLTVFLVSIIGVLVCLYMRYKKRKEIKKIADMLSMSRNSDFQIREQDSPIVIRHLSQLVALHASE